MIYQSLSVRRNLKQPPEMVEGIPTHAEPAIWRHVEPFLYDADGLDLDIMEALVASLRWHVGGQPSLPAIHHLASQNDDDYLDLLDFLLNLQTSSAHTFRNSIRNILELAGSVWTTDPGGATGLKRRVTDQAQEAFREAAAPDDLAARHLETAWTKAFGRNCDPARSWSSAIKAVEALLQPIIEPKNAQATLGSMLSKLRDTSDKWCLVVDTVKGDDKGSKLLLSALEMIWIDPGRHGTDDRQIGIEEARVVVLQAVTIVEWLRAGALQHRNGK